MLEDEHEMASGYTPRPLRQPAGHTQNGASQVKDGYQSVEMFEHRREHASEHTALSLDVEDQLTAEEMHGTVETEPPNFTLWKPGCYVLGKGRNLSHTVMILSFMIAVWLFGAKFVPDTAWLRWLFHPMACLSILQAFVVCFRDPGFLQRKSMVRSEFEVLRKEGRLTCRKCLTLDTDKVKHCTYCNCCVQELDHHCDVFGICIAKNNLQCFWGAIIMGVLTLMYVYMNVMMFVNEFVDQNSKTGGIPTPAPKA